MEEGDGLRDASVPIITAIFRPAPLLSSSILISEDEGNRHNPYRLVVDITGRVDRVAVESCCISVSVRIFSHILAAPTIPVNL